MSSRLCAVSAMPAAGDGAEVILPCQYFDLSGGERQSGEQRLMFALLVDAINVYQRGMMSRAPRARRLSVDAELWMMARRAAGDALGFELVCDAVGIDPVLLRRRLIEWKHTVRRRRAPQSPVRLSITPRLRGSVRRRGRQPGRSLLADVTVSRAAASAIGVVPGPGLHEVEDVGAAVAVRGISARRDR